MSRRGGSRPDAAAPPRAVPPARYAPWIAAIVGAACHLSSLGNGFTYDDNAIVRDNPRIRTLADPRIWLTDWWAMPEAADDPLLDPSRDRLYRPLTLLTFALNYAAGGLNPLGYHAVNVLLHAGVCVLVWHLARRVFADAAVAGAAALLFAVHPVHAEAVAGLVGRAEVLAAALLLAGLLALLPARGPRTATRTWWAAAAFLGALLAKETAICYPLLALAMLVHTARFPPPEDAGRRDDAGGRRCGGWATAAILLAPLAVYLPLRFVALDMHLLRERASASFFNPLVDADAWGRLHGPLTVLGHYARLIFMPRTLSCDYGTAVIDPNAGPVALTLVGLVAAVGLIASSVAWLRHVWPGRAARPGEGIAPGLHLMAVLFLASYGLISNTVLLIGVSLAERLLYWPSAPALIAVAAIGVRAWRTQCGPGGSLPGLARIAPALGCLVLLALGARSCDRGLDWRSDRALFEADVATYPQNAHLSVALAQILIADAEGLPPEDPRRESTLRRAEGLIERALAVHSRFPSAIRLQAIACELRGDFQRAVSLYELALRLHPGDRRAQARLANLRGDIWPKSARLAELLERIGGNPRDVAARLEAGELLIGLARNYEALQQFEAAVALAPEDPRALRGYGQALILNRQEPQARDVLLRAVRIDPGDWESHANLAALFEYSDPQASLRHAQAAFELQPNNVSVAIALATALSLNGRIDESLAHYRRILAALPADDPLRARVAERIREVERMR